MDIIAAVRPLGRELVRFDRTQVSYIAPLRNAIGVAAPLAVGAATGRLITGLTISIGALNVAFSDRPGPYRLRAGRMMLAGAWGALSVFVGSSTGGIGWLTVLLVAIWGPGSGILAALGPAALQIGLTGVILLLVYGAYSLSPGNAAVQGGLILVGAALQVILAIAIWPVRRLGPEREALAAVFRQLATAARSTGEAESAPPASGETTIASTTLIGIGSSQTARGEALRAILDEAERIRLEVAGLSGVERTLRRANPDDAVVRVAADFRSGSTRRASSTPASPAGWPAQMPKHRLLVSRRSPCVPIRT